jgi:hypothetical protein
MLWLVAEPSFAKLLIVELWFSFLFGIYNGAMVPFLTEIMPAEVRTAGFSPAYSLATAIFGGFTPAVCTYLIEVTGSKAAPALWLSMAAIIWKSGRVEGWKDGRVEEWKSGRMEGWKDGRMEGWKDGRVEGWKGGRVEGWKSGRMEGWKGGRMEGWKGGRMEG